jgi:hypothetical protein
MKAAARRGTPGTAESRGVGRVRKPDESNLGDLRSPACPRSGERDSQDEKQTADYTPVFE